MAGKTKEIPLMKRGTTRAPSGPLGGVSNQGQQALTSTLEKCTDQAAALQAGKPKHNAENPTKYQHFWWSELLQKRREPSYWHLSSVPFTPMENGFPKFQCQAE